MAMYACVTTCSILAAAVYAATSVDPRMFKEDWTIIVPMAVIEYWSAIGIPTLSCAYRSILFGRQSSFVIRSICTFFPI